MSYNPNHRRGLYQKLKPRKRSYYGKKENTLTPIEHSDFYPFLKRFLEWTVVKGLSEQTQRQRYYGLHRFIVWCDERSLNHPNEITKPILDSYQNYLFYCRKANGEALGISSQQTLLMAVKNFFKWLMKSNYILYNPASELELPKRPKRLPQAILSVEEVQRILHLPDTTSPYGIRDKAILETLYSTGIRKSECIHLSVYDIDTSRKTLWVRQGKGNKDRVLPLGESALRWIERYRLEVRQELLVNSEETSLFLTDYGEPMINNRLVDLVKRYFYHADISKPGACHLFRHSMATHMLENGADIRFIQAMLGHSDLSTTEIYTRVSISKLQEIHAATLPTLDNVVPENVEKS